MKKNNYLSVQLLLIGFLISFSVGCGTYSSVPASSSFSPEDFEPGKCYAKCSVVDNYSFTNQTVAVYTGDSKTEQVTLQYFQVEVSPATSKWVKKKADRNCLSSNLDDCLVWCLVDMPATFKTVAVLQDTSESQHFRFEKLKASNPDNQLMKLEFQEVICQENITSDLIADLTDRLLLEGYLVEPGNGGMDETFKKAILKYQIDHSLAQGQLTIETLDMMGVNY